MLPVVGQFFPVWHHSVVKLLVIGSTKTWKMRDGRTLETTHDGIVVSIK